MEDTYYDVLGVDQDASQEEIITAYREKIKESHPDRNDGPNAQERTIQLNEAKKVLTDPKSRAEYDHQIEADSNRQTEHSDQTTNRKEADAEQRSRRQQRQRDRNRQQDQSRQQRQTNRQRQQHRQKTRDRQQQQQETNRQRQRRQRDQKTRDRQQRQQQDRQQQNQQETNRQRHRQRQHRTNRTNRETRGRSQERNKRQTRTRKQERDHTTSTERGQMDAGEQIWEAIRVGRWQFHRVFATATPPYSIPVNRKHMAAVIRSPTTIRLVAAYALVFIATEILLHFGYDFRASEAGKFMLLLGSLLVSYAGYELAAPLPFEESRSRGRFKPASRKRIWPILPANTFGIILIISSVITGTAADVLNFTIYGILWIGVLGSFLTFGCYYLFGRVGGWMSSNLQRQGAKTGFAFGPIVTVALLFTRWGGEVAIPKSLASTGKNFELWVPQLVVGPIYLGAIANFTLGTLMIGSLLWSIIGMCRYLSAVPWTDRYQHGYRVQPGIWNFLLTAPIIMLSWMLVEDISTIKLPIAEVTIAVAQDTLLIGLFVMPSILTGAYLLRRQAEPKLRETIWK